MASLQLRGKSYACVFCWHGKRQWFTIGKVAEEEAKAKASQVEYLLMRLKQRLIDLPPGIDIVEFVQHDGKLARQTSGRPGANPGADAAGFPRPLPGHPPGVARRPDRRGHRAAFQAPLPPWASGFPIRELKLADLRATWTGGPRRKARVASGSARPRSARRSSRCARRGTGRRGWDWWRGGSL